MAAKKSARGRVVIGLKYIDGHQRGQVLAGRKVPGDGGVRPYTDAELDEFIAKRQAREATKAEVKQLADAGYLVAEQPATPVPA